MKFKISQFLNRFIGISLETGGFIVFSGFLVAAVTWYLSVTLAIWPAYAGFSASMAVIILTITSILFLLRIMGDDEIKTVLHHISRQLDNHDQRLDEIFHNVVH